MEATFGLIKPDGVAKKLTGKIIDTIEKEDLRVTAIKMVHINKNAETRKKFW